MTITATLDKCWRDECFGKYDFEKLEYFLCMAYHVCKDIDSTEWFENWPGDIRGYIADAYSAIGLWNRVNQLHDNAPDEHDVEINSKLHDVQPVLCVFNQYCERLNESAGVEWKYKVIEDLSRRCLLLSATLLPDIPAELVSGMKKFLDYFADHNEEALRENCYESKNTD